MDSADKGLTPRLRLRAGEWVQVRTKEEILGTLDSDGRLDGHFYRCVRMGFPHSEKSEENIGCLK